MNAKTVVKVVAGLTVGALTMGGLAGCAPQNCTAPAPVMKGMPGCKGMMKTHSSKKADYRK